MLVRCKFHLKQRILKNAKNLKDKTNTRGDFYYINKQLPDQLAEQNREIRDTVRYYREKNEKLHKRDQAKIEVKNRTVIVNGEPIVKEVLPVEVDDLFPDKQEMDKQDKLKLAVSDAITQDVSSFMAYAFKTGQLHEVQRAYRRIRRAHPGATHVIAAYNLKNNRGYQDDGEHSAGMRLLKKLETEFVQNSAVYVVRVYGGKHLRPQRFEHILDAADQALTRAGLEPLST